MSAARNGFDRARLRAELVRDEGLRLRPYRCSAGALTIGVGRNLDDRGITRAEALAMLDADIGAACDDLDRRAPWWRGLPAPARRGLANMAFNLGWPRLSGFRSMLAALEAGDWDRAADEALDSRWAAQVGDRAQRVAALFRANGAGRRPPATDHRPQGTPS